MELEILIFYAKWLNRCLSIHYMKHTIRWILVSVLACVICSAVTFSIAYHRGYQRGHWKGYDGGIAESRYAESLGLCNALWILRTGTFLAPLVRWKRNVLPRQKYISTIRLSAPIPTQRWQKTWRCIALPIEPIAQIGMIGSGSWKFNWRK
ncbi:MAG TPA: hypothetical protein VGM58_05230 [Verrucomicrobiae bacterium]